MTLVLVLLLIPVYPNIFEDRNKKLLFTSQDIVNCFGKRYEAFASDITDHSFEYIEYVYISFFNNNSKRFM